MTEYYKLIKKKRSVRNMLYFLSFLLTFLIIALVVSGIGNSLHVLK